MPATHPDIYRGIFVDFIFSPGVVKLSGHERGPEIETKAAKGSTGASNTAHGERIARFTATFTFAELDEIELWESFVKVLESSYRGPKVKALPIFHPDLARQRITEAIVESIGPLEWDDRGGGRAEVKFTEYRPPKAKAVAKASGGQRTGTTTVDPNAAAKRELELLLAQAKKL